jgi:GNAT superfamily N-acetyltransferase
MQEKPFMRRAIHAGIERMEIGAIADGDVEAVLDLWARCGLLHPDNDARADIARARKAADATLLVGRKDAAVIATALAGFDGHRGWVYYLAVEPHLRRAGHGKAMLRAAERWLRARGAPKLGFTRSPVVTMGKRL